MQSWSENDHRVGFRVNIVPTRGSRPRDNKFPDRSQSQSKPTKSLFEEISQGREFAIPIAGDEEFLGTHLDVPGKYDLSNRSGVTIVNKYSPLQHLGGASHGVALVSYCNNYSEDLSSPDANAAILVSTKTALSNLLQQFKEFETSLIFFNIGPNSGASLRQLHCQSYLLPHNSGLISYSCGQAYNSAKAELKSCLICSMAHEDCCKDHLGQEHDLQTRTIWQDDNCRVLVPFAPIRALSMRVLLKRHVSGFTRSNPNELKSLGKALSIANEAIKVGTPSKWPVNLDRAVAFRQANSYTSDFHYFIDVIPAIPFGGSELVDSLSITTLLPEKTAEIIKRKMSAEM